MVLQWMDGHNTTNWSWGIQFIAHKKNNRYHEGIKQIPYVFRYGQPCRVGLSRMNLPTVLLGSVQTEEDLDRVLNEASVVVANLRGVTELNATNTRRPHASRTATNSIEATLPVTNTNNNVVM